MLDRRSVYVENFFAKLNDEEIDALILPPHGLPAMRHEDSTHLLPAASYCFLVNLLGLPTGVVSATQVRADEQSQRPESRDWVDRLAAGTDEESEGLPIGVQVAARPWREDVVLAVMQSLEDGLG